MADVKPKQSKNWFMDWPLDDHIATREMLFGVDLPARSTSSGISVLLQNCDLPPPLRFFSPLTAEEDAKKNKISPVSATQYTPPLRVPSSKSNQGVVDTPGADHGGEESTSLLRALQLSQTRAREAEKKASAEITRNQKMARAFLEDSLKLSAYKQWVKLLELEIWMLQGKGSPVQQQRLSDRWVPQQGPGDGPGQSPPAATWCLTVAFCLGIATVGFVLGRYLF